jgi:hypothetical protein
MILIKIILGLFIFLIRLIIKLVRVILKQATKSFFAFIDTIQIILSLQISIVWLKIITVNFAQTDDAMDLIASANSLQNYQDYYRSVCHFNSFITFLRILQFFNFSKKLSAFTEVLSKAKYDILFFVLMFAFVSLQIYNACVDDGRLFSGGLRAIRRKP